MFSDSESQGPGGMVLDFRLRGMGGKAWMAALTLSLPRVPYGTLA